MTMIGKSARGRDAIWNSVVSATIAVALGLAVSMSATAVAFAQAASTETPAAAAPAVPPAAPSATPAATPEPAPAAQPATLGEAGGAPATAPRGEPAIAAHLPKDLSPWGMFMGADIVVKLIMLGLLFASLVTWTVWLAKTIELVMAKRQAQKSIRVLQEARSLAEARDDIEKRLLQEEAQGIQERWIAGLRAKAYIKTF